MNRNEEVQERIDLEEFHKFQDAALERLVVEANPTDAADKAVATLVKAHREGWLVDALWRRIMFLGRGGANVAGGPNREEWVWLRNLATSISPGRPEFLNDEAYAGGAASI